MNERILAPSSCKRPGKSFFMTAIPDVLTPLPPEELRKMDAYWRACNYLSAGMIYLRANPLLREPLKPEHIKNRLLGHWGRIPGNLSFGSI